MCFHHNDRQVNVVYGNNSVYRKDHTKHINTLSGRIEEFLVLNPTVPTVGYHCALEGSRVKRYYVGSFSLQGCGWIADCNHRLIIHSSQIRIKQTNAFRMSRRAGTRCNGCYQLRACHPRVTVSNLQESRRS